MKSKEKSIRDILKEYLKDMEFLTGLKQFREMNKEDVVRLIDYLEETAKTFRWMNPKRLDFILKNGMQGSYGDFYGMNVKTLTKWLSMYYEQNKHQIIIELGAMGEIETEISDQEKEYWRNIGRKRFKENWDQAKDSGFVNDLDKWGPYWYKKMVDKGVLKENLYPMKELEENAKRMLRVERKDRNPASIKAKVDNAIWKEFISYCIQHGPDLSKLID